MRYKKEYLERKGENCPYCNSRNIMGIENIQADGEGAHQSVECHDCGKLWKDIYKLVDVTEE